MIYVQICASVCVLLGVSMGWGNTRKVYIYTYLDFFNSLLKLDMDVFDYNFPSLPDYLSEFLSSIGSITF